MSALRVMSDGNSPALSATAEELARQAEFILSALDAGTHPSTYADRRQAPRLPYRVKGTFHLYSAAPGEDPKVLFTRDVCPRGLGFITPYRLPLGYGGTLELHSPNGSTLTLDCTLLRCRETVNGWFEGAVYFNRPQYHFENPEPEPEPVDPLAD